jgi:Raf kinase inhibitor-like YbhB/YbcL family protein
MYRFAMGGLAATAIVFVASAPAAAASSFTLTSSALKDNDVMPAQYTGNNRSNPNCVGENISLPLAWSNVPAGTKGFALVMTDPEARGGLDVVHWVAYGIPASVTSFAEGEVSKASDKYIGGKSTMNLPSYFGPCTPPSTGYHHYTLVMIATNLDPKALKAGMTRDALMAALKGHTKGSAGLIARFGKP